MKKIISILFISVFAAAAALAQCGAWQSVPSGTTQLLRAVHFPDAQNGWAVGSGGVLLRSANGGGSWSSQSAALGAGSTELYAVHFASATTGWVVGAGGFVKKTTNGGGTWSPQNVNTSTDLYDVFFVDANWGWIVGACGLILRTTNGGGQWTPVSSGQNYHLFAVDTTGNGNMAAASSGTALLKSSDFGMSWSPSNGLSGHRNFRAMAFSGATGWAANTEGKVWKTTNGGALWLFWGSAAPFTGVWQSAAAASSNEVWLAGLAGKLIRSTNGGSIWTDFSDGIASEDLYGLQMLNDSTGWAVGAGGAIFRYVPSSVPPACIATLPLHQQTKVATTVPITWAAVGGCVNGYRLSLGTAPGGSDVLNNQDVGNVTTYQPAAALPANKTIYVRIVPYNGAGSASGCEEFSFTTSACGTATQIVPFFPADTVVACSFSAATPIAAGVPYGQSANQTFPLYPPSPLSHLEVSFTDQVLPICDGNATILRTWTVFDPCLPNTSNPPNPAYFTQQISVEDKQGPVLPCPQNLTVDVDPVSCCATVNLPDVLLIDSCSRVKSLEAIVTTIDPVTLDTLDSILVYGILVSFPGNDILFPDTLGVLGDTPCLPRGTHTVTYTVSDDCGQTSSCGFFLTVVDSAACVSLVTPADKSGNISVQTALQWASASKCTTGYRLSLGTAPGGSDVLNNQDVGNVTSYQPAQPLPFGKTIYVRVVPYSGSGTANGCTEFSFTTQIECSIAQPPVIAGPAVLCGAAAQLDAGNGYSKYAWTGPNGFMAAVRQPTVAAPGTYSVTVTDANGCTGTDDFVLAPGQPVLAAISYPNGAAITCTQNTVSMQASGGAQYLWSANLGATATVVATAPNTYRVTVTDANGCTATATAVVTLDQTPPNATASGGTLTCTAATLQLNGQTTTPNATGHWTGPNNFNATNFTPTVSAGGIYLLEVTAPNGCTRTAQATVVEDKAPPSVSAAGASLSCQQTSVALFGNSATPGATYAWGGPNAFSSTAKNPMTSTPGTYTLTVSAPNGCTATATATVGGSPDLPVASASGGTLSCTSPSVVLIGGSSLPGSYAWTGPGGFTSAAQKPSVSVSGIYTLTVSSSPGCAATATATVTDNQQPPNISAAGGTLACVNPGVVLQGASTTTGATYAWVGPSGFTSSMQQPKVTVAGTYTLTVRNPDNGCTATKTVQVTAPTLPSTSIAGAKPICPGGMAALTASGNGVFDWAGPNGFMYSGPSPTVNTPGMYTVVLTDANQCTATATASIPAAPPLLVTISGEKAFCPGGAATLEATGGNMYAWTGPNGFAANGAQQVVNSPGLYTVTGSNAEGCTGTNTVTAVQHPAPTALLLSSDPDNTVCTGDAVTFTASGGLAYQFWLNQQPQGLFNSVNTFSPTGLANGSQIAVRVVDEHACQDSTVLGDGPGREPITLAVQPLPNLSGWSLARLPACPEDPVRILINAPNLAGGVYTFDWELDSQPAQTLQQNISSGVGVLNLGVLSAGFHLGRVSNLGLGNGTCTATPSSGGGIGFEVKPLAAGTLDTAVCIGQPVKVGSQVFTQSGNYTVTLQTQPGGCDSTVTLKLQSVTTLPVQRTAQFCAGGFYNFYGDTLKTAGFYQKIRPGAVPGCDSLVLLILSELSHVFDFRNATICPGESFVFGDTSFTTAGPHQVTLRSALGCDSFTLLLNLKISPIEVSFSAEELRVCKDEPVQLQTMVQNCANCQYEWSTGASGVSAIFAPSTAVTATYSVTVTDNKGCKASDQLLLTVVQPSASERDTLLCPGESLLFCGKTITQSGEQVCTYPSKDGCDSTVTLRVTVFDPKQFDVARDTQVIMPPDELSWSFKVAHNNYPADYRHVILNPPPAKGKVEVDPDQRLRYTPDPDKRSGLDVVHYELCPPANCPDACFEAVLTINLQGVAVEEIEKKMPNLITPNGDDKNDYFDPLAYIQANESPTDGILEQLFIYNRWGELLRRYPRYPKGGWDGADEKGHVPPQATYYFLLEYQIGGKAYRRTGPVNLLH